MAVSPNPIQAPNLGSEIPAERVRRGAGFYKALALDVLTVLLAVGWSFLLREFYAGRMAVWWLLLELVLFLAASSLGWLLTPSRSRRVAVVALFALGLVSFFWNAPFQILAAVALGGFAFMFLGESIARSNFENSLELRFFRAVRPQLNRYITAVTLVAVLLYLPQWDATQSFMSKQTFRSVYVSLATAAERYYLGQVRFDANFEEFARSYADFGLSSNPSYASLPPAQHALVLDEATGKLKQGLSQVAGKEIPDSQPMYQVFYDFAIRQLQGWDQKFGAQFLFVWAVAVFFFLRGLGVIFYMFAAGFAYLVYEFLVAVNVIRVSGEPRLHETAEFS